MSIKITQPFEFDSQLPNFDRDVINSYSFTNHSPYKLTVEERTELGLKYDVGHIVWDTYTKKNYSVEYVNSNYCLTPLKPLAKTNQEWLDLESTYIPMAGEVIIYTDYMQVNGVNTPTFKIGDGTTSLSNLPFTSAAYATNAGTADVAKKVEHQLHIGPHDYDGSAEVTIGLYNSTYTEE